MRYNKSMNKEHDCVNEQAINIVYDRLTKFEDNVKSDLKDTNNKIDSVDKKLSRVITIGIIFIVLSIISNPVLNELILKIKPAFATP